VHDGAWDGATDGDPVRASGGLRRGVGLLLAVLVLAGATGGRAASAAAAATTRRLVTVPGSARLLAVDAFTSLYSPRGSVVARFEQIAPAPAGRGTRLLVDVGGRLLPAPAGVTGYSTGDPVAVTVSVPRARASPAAGRGWSGSPGSTPPATPRPGRRAAWSAAW
jgi:hypothetical protein